MFKLQMPPVPIETSQVLFDLSRLLRSRNRAFATGVDRIDLEIALDLAARFKTSCYFLYAGAAGVTILRHETGISLLRALDARWNGKQSPNERARSTQSYTAEIAYGSVTRRDRRTVVTSDTTYVVASHSGLGKIKGGIGRLDPRKAMKRVIYIHDIIPLEMPEYQRPETRPAFENYLGELMDAPVTIASNSHDTDTRFRQLAGTKGWTVERFIVLKPALVPTTAARLPIRTEIETFISRQRSFFTVIGTIEPRKNHLFLLNLWRQMLEQQEDAPHLCIIGKRGWENENVLDMLDRCVAIKGSVTEFGDLSDGEVQAVMKASTALLFPSFVEGLGIPLLEAAALDLPCIVSDIPVFREIAPTGTVFLDPLDGPGWKREIISRSLPPAHDITRQVG